MSTIPASASSIVEETKKKLEASLSNDEAMKSDEDSVSPPKHSDETNAVCSEPAPEDSLGTASEGDGLETADDEERTRLNIEETFRSAELNLM
ncbi:unnamed protein product [Heligmosomoides polygyrus]|uniref:Uncharacterized protein n=1 Tax=Heligmosomoides polygyrus TaxID=6339 RepID=A0A183G6C7_HELPZ|nr:unnamed protein product [Heligmosomoides polygyrus]